MRKRLIKKVAVTALLLAVSSSVIINMTIYECLKKAGFKRWLITNKNCGSSGTQFINKSYTSNGNMWALKKKKS